MSVVPSERGGELLILMMFSVYLVSVAHQEEITIFARRELSNLAYIGHV